MESKFMIEAFKEAEKAFLEGEIPVGAVIVKNNVIISRSHNTKESQKCCINHAEINAISEASKKLNNWRLNGCDIYITLDPCPMCASAIKQARISNVYSAISNLDDNNSELIKKIFEFNDINSSINFESNLDCDSGRDILQKFFLKRRK